MVFHWNNRPSLGFAKGIIPTSSVVQKVKTACSLKTMSYSDNLVYVNDEQLFGE